MINHLQRIFFKSLLILIIGSVSYSIYAVGKGGKRRNRGKRGRTPTTHYRIQKATQQGVKSRNKSQTLQQVTEEGLPAKTRSQQRRRGKSQTLQQVTERVLEAQVELFVAKAELSATEQVYEIRRAALEEGLRELMKELQIEEGGRGEVEEKKVQEAFIELVKLKAESKLSEEEKKVYKVLEAMRKWEKESTVELSEVEKKGSSKENAFDTLLTEMEAISKWEKESTVEEKRKAGLLVGSENEKLVSQLQSVEAKISVASTENEVKEALAEMSTEAQKVTQNGGQKPLNHCAGTFNEK